MLDNLRYYAYVTLDDLAPADVPTVLYSNSDKVMPINFGQRIDVNSVPQGIKMINAVKYLPTSTYDILHFATGFTTFKEFGDIYGNNDMHVYIYPLKPVRDANTDVITHFTYDTDVGYRTDLQFRGYYEELTETTPYTTTGDVGRYTWSINYQPVLYDINTSTWSAVSVSSGSGTGGVVGVRSYEYYALYGIPGSTTTLSVQKDMAAFMGGEDVAYNSPPYDDKRMGIKYYWRGDTGFWEDSIQDYFQQFYHPWWFHNGYTAEQVVALASYNSVTYLALDILTPSTPITDGGEDYVKFNYSTSERARAVIYYTCKAIGGQGALEVDDQEGYEILEDENSEEYNGEGDFDKDSENIEMSANILEAWRYMDGEGPHIIRCVDHIDFANFMKLFYTYVTNPGMGVHNGLEYISNNGMSIGDVFINICAIPSQFNVWQSSSQVIKFSGYGDTQANSIYRTVDTTSTEVYNVYSQTSYELSMGELDVSEYFGSFLDYDPYTKIQIFLPFIGYRNLDVNAVMGSTIELIYKADVITGDCVANIIVKKDKFGTDLNSILYSFTGSLGRHFPLSQGAFYNHSIAQQQAFMKTQAAIITAGSVALGTMFGGPGVGSTIGGIVGGATSMMVNNDPMMSVSKRSNGSRTGECNSVAAYMSTLTPHLIIDRPITAIPTGFAHNKGRELGVTKTLNTLLGFTVISDIHLDSVATMTNEDKNDMMEILRSGVII